VNTISFTKSPSNAFEQSPAYARNRLASTGRWRAAEGIKIWQGRRGFLSRVGSADVCVPLSVANNNKHFLTRVVAASCGYAITTRQCVWNPMADPPAWESISGSTTFAGARNNVTQTTDKDSGQTSVEADCYPGDLTTGDNAAATGICGGGIPPHLETLFCAPAVPTPWIGVWADLDYVAGMYVPRGCGSTGEQWDGDPATAEAFFGAGGVVVDVTFDTVTNTHIGLHVSWSYDVTSDEPCPTDPPVGDDPTVLCREEHVEGSLDVSVTLSDEYTWMDCADDAISLAASQNRCADLAEVGLPPQSWVFVSQKETQGAPGAGCTESIDPTMDGSIVVAGATDPAPYATAWNWLLFDGTNVQVQIWSQKAGKFPAYNWQGGAARTGRYLVLGVLFNGCAATETQTCASATALSSCGEYVCDPPSTETLAAAADVNFPGMVWVGWVIQGIQDPIDPSPRCWVEPRSCGADASYSLPPTNTGGSFEFFPLDTTDGGSALTGPPFPGEPGNDSDSGPPVCG
jgi:hypothetical protein